MQLKPQLLYEFGPFRIDAADRLLLRDGKALAIPPKAFDLLVTLVENSGHVLSKDDLLQQVWPDTHVEEANLSYHVYTLRKALGEEKDGARYIETIPRRGYRFVAQVIEIRAAGADIILAERSRSRIFMEEGETRRVADQAVAEPDMPVTALTATQKAAGKFSPRQVRRLLGAGTLAVVLAVCVVLYFNLRPGKKAGLPPMKIVPLTTFPDEEFDSALSPDGKFVAFAWQGGLLDRINIYVQQIDAGAPLRLTTKAGRDGDAAWSPDGRYIAYVHKSLDGKNEINQMPAFGGPERNLYATTSSIVGLSWSADGKTLVFSMRDAEESPYHVYQLAIDEMKATQLTAAPDGSYGDYRPVFSPDGKTVAFLRRLDVVGTTDIYLVGTDAGEPHRLTFDKRYIYGLAWTADGEALVFSSGRLGVQKLWKISAGGGEPEQLTVGTENAYSPSISRTGNRLTYTQIYWDTNIWRVPAITAHEPAAPVKLISSTLRDQTPNLSPDGKRLVFESTRSGSHELWVADSDGSQPLQLTSFSIGETSHPRWSPDGRQLAFESHSEDYPHVYVINAEGGAPRKLTDGPLSDKVPSWSKDGQWVYFGSNRNGTWQVWKAPAGGGEAVQVTTNGGYEALESNDGQFLYYNKFGFNQVGLFRIPVAGGQEISIFDFIQLNSVGDWCLSNKGVYYIHRYDERRKVSLQPAIKFFDFATRRVTTVAPLEKDPGTCPGLNVSADGQWFILSKYDSRNHDIMLAENFR